jgi:type I restriction enzyme, S subunit
MSKIYIDNPNLIVAKSIIFGSLQNGKTTNIFEVMTLTSGEYLPISKMELGEVKVYGGGGLTKQTHSIYNLDYETVGIGRVGARCGCAFLVETNSWVTDNALYISKLKGNYDLRFLVHYLNYANLNDMANTAAQPVISLKRISNVKIPLIEIETQKEISNILDEIECGKYFFDDDNFGLNSHLSKIKNIKVLQTELKTQSNLLSKLRQAYLQEVVMGKLTEPSQDNAQTLLKAIKSQKAEFIKQGKLRKEKPLAPIKPEEIPFEIPDNWAWCRLGEVCSKIGSGSTPQGSNYASEGIPFFRSQNIYDDELRLDGAFHISTEVHKQMNGTVVLAEDILLNITGGSMGRCALVPNDFLEGNVSQHVCIIRPLTMDNTFFHKLVLSPYFQKLIFSSTTGAGREGLPKYNLERFLVPIPPLSEQKAIVAKVEGLLGNISLLESENKAQQIEVQRLMGAVLQEAFGGK